MLGVVKWFDKIKKFGFIRPQDGSQDVFVHLSALAPETASQVTEGAQVDYEVTAGAKGPQAANVRVVS